MLNMKLADHRRTRDHLVFRGPDSCYENNLEWSSVFVTLAPGEEFEGNAFGSVCLSFCMPAWARNSKTNAPIDLIFYTSNIIPMDRSSSKMVRIRIWTQEFI